MEVNLDYLKFLCGIGITKTIRNQNTNTLLKTKPPPLFLKGTAARTLPIPAINAKELLMGTAYFPEFNTPPAGALYCTS